LVRCQRVHRRWNVFQHLRIKRLYSRSAINVAKRVAMQTRVSCVGFLRQCCSFCEQLRHFNLRPFAQNAHTHAPHLSHKEVDLFEMIDVLQLSPLRPEVQKELVLRYSVHRRDEFDSVCDRVRAVVSNSATGPTLEQLKRMPKLEIICLASVGYDSVPIDEAKKRVRMRAGHYRDKLWRVGDPSHEHT
jgi:hypothetical protein